MALLLSIIVLLTRLVSGPEVFVSVGVTLSGVLILYWSGGIVGGMVLGLLLPLTTWRWGAALVGAICAIPMYLAVAWIVQNDLDVAGSIVLGSVVGGAVGYGLWIPPARQHDEP